MKRLFILFFLLTPLFSFAQFSAALGAGYMAPINDFAKTHSSGFNVAAIGEYEFATVSVLGEIAYNSFAAKKDLLIPAQDLSAVSLTAGVSAVLKEPFYMEMRLGYYFGDIKSSAAVVAPGLRFGKFDINAGFNVLAPNPFFNLRAAYFLFGE